MKRVVDLLPLALVCLFTLPSPAQSTHVQEERLLDPLTRPGGSLGAGLALSGQRAALGGAVASQPGLVLTYRRSAGLWQHEAGAQALDGAPNDEFGTALALDGSTLVVGAPNATVNGLTAGAAYVFVFDGANWVQQAKFTPAAPKGQGRFGAAVAVDGNTLAIGAPQTDLGSKGQVDVYVRSGPGWTFQQTLMPGGLSSGARAGSSLALEGDRLVVGAPVQWVNNLIQVGQAFVFERVAGSWSQQALLESPAPIATGSFGASVALDGTRIVVGATGEPSVNTLEGRAHVFERSGNAWVWRQTLAGTGTGMNSSFGHAVALSGARILVGAPGHTNAQAAFAGTVKYFAFDGTSWNERADLYGTTSSLNDNLGRSVALKGDLALGGAPNGDTPTTARGEAYAWQVDPPPASSYCTAKTTSGNCLPQMGWTGTCSASSATPFLVGATQVPNGKSGILFYGAAHDQKPFQGGVRCVATPVRRTPQQTSGGSPSGSDCTGSYSFDFNSRVQSGQDPSLAAGSWVYAQYWFRDPGSASTTGLSNALRFSIAP